MVRDRDGCCLLTRSELGVSECCHIIPVCENRRRHTVSRDFLRKLETESGIFLSTSITEVPFAGSISMQMPGVAKEKTSDNNQVCFVLQAATHPSNPFHAITLHQNFNQMFDNGLLWVEVYDQIAYIFFHSTVEDTSFPTGFTRQSCHGAPIMNYRSSSLYQRPTSELFAFHRVFHASVIQHERGLETEALESHERQLLSTLPIADMSRDMNGLQLHD